MKRPINKFLTELAERKTTDLILLSIGNPSPKYDATRHSAGHLTLDYVAQYMGGLGDGSKYQSSSVKMAPLLEHPNIFLAKSQEYMNLSGKAVKASLKYFHNGEYRLVVLHDDIDTEVGECKFKLESRQVGGHGGLKSIVQMYSDPFARLRIGIGMPPARTQGEVANYVLKKMSLREKEIFNSQTLPAALDMTREMAQAFNKKRSRRSSLN